jgi:hypothetical protein
MSWIVNFFIVKCSQQENREQESDGIVLTVEYFSEVKIWLCCGWAGASAAHAQ